MTARQIEHLDPATIAALVDRTIDREAHAEAEAHLAICADCREVWIETSEMAVVAKNTVPDAGGTPTQGGDPAAAPVRARSRWWMYAGAAIAAPVLAGVLWDARPDPPAEADMGVERLALALGSNRTTLGRLSGPFEWGRPPEAARGDARLQLSLEVREAANDLEKLAAQPDASRLSASGKAQLLTGRVDEAVKTLNEAVRLAPSHSDARADLAAAYLERWARVHDNADAIRALDEAQRALQSSPKHPAALFNRAQALQALDMKEAARRAWEAFLDADATSGWAQEARARLKELDIDRTTSAVPVPSRTKRARRSPGAP